MWPGLWFGKGVREAPIDLKDTERKYEVYAEIPGILKEDIEVHVTPHNMAIRGKTKTKKKEEKQGYIWQERGYSTITRAIHFPDEVNPDDAEAELEDGVLKVTVPKKKLTLKEKGKRITVT